MPAGPRKPVERHNGRVYWPTRDVGVGFVDFFHAPGRILGTQTFRAAGVVRIGTQRILRGRDRILGTQRMRRRTRGFERGGKSTWRCCREVVHNITMVGGVVNIKQ